MFVGVGVLVDVGIKVGPNNCPGPQEDINNIAIIIIEATFSFIAPPTLSGRTRLSQIGKSAWVNLPNGPLHPRGANFSLKPLLRRKPREL